MKQTQMHKLDLTKISGNGDFSCPGCGATLSPDDCSEEGYSILEAKVNHEGLEEVIIVCKTCASQIDLTGFSLLQELVEIGESDEHKIRESKEYIAHV